MGATICNRFNRRSQRDLWTRRFATLSARAVLPDDLSIDSTAVRAHHSAHAVKGGGEKSGHGALAWWSDHQNPCVDKGLRAVAFIPCPENGADIWAAPALLDKLPPPARLPADTGSDANSLRARLAASKTAALIPSARFRKIPVPHDAVAYIGRNLIKRAFCRLIPKALAP